jgi:hypothetical protein
MEVGQGPNWGCSAKQKKKYVNTQWTNWYNIELKTENILSIIKYTATSRGPRHQIKQVSIGRGGNIRSTLLEFSSLSGRPVKQRNRFFSNDLYLFHAHDSCTTESFQGVSRGTFDVGFTTCEIYFFVSAGGAVPRFRTAFKFRFVFL